MLYHRQTVQIRLVKFCISAIIETIANMLITTAIVYDKGCVETAIFANTKHTEELIRDNETSNHPVSGVSIIFVIHVCRTFRDDSSDSERGNRRHHHTSIARDSGSSARDPVVAAAAAAPSASDVGVCDVGTPRGRRRPPELGDDNRFQPIQVYPPAFQQQQYQKKYASIDQDYRQRLERQMDVVNCNRKSSHGGPNYQNQQWQKQPDDQAGGGSCSFRRGVSTDSGVSYRGTITATSSRPSASQISSERFVVLCCARV